MPEQAEWGNDDPVTYDTGKVYYYRGQLMVDGKPIALTVTASTGIDCRTSDQKLNSRLTDIETGLSLLATEVGHLREDVVRLASGASQI